MNVVGYVRLSRDEDKENYSSIISQKEIIKEYAEHKKWIISNIYIDDNYSGYNFNRPGFIEMIRGIKGGNIDIIIAKDLSRIGRNNGGVLVLIDRLREQGIRLILVNESNGGLDLLEDDQDILGIKTWYNEMYVKDISRKVRASMHFKQKNGELIMGNTYGYKKIRINNTLHLVIDEEIKPVIQLIFREYIGGLGYKKICYLLNEKGYPTPSEYHKKNHEEKGRVFKNTSTENWQSYMIARILQNDIYTGTLRTRKRQSRLIKGKQEKVPEKEQYVFPKHHDAIIDENTFCLAQNINRKRNDRAFNSGRAKYNYIFKGFIQCGDCSSNSAGFIVRRSPAVIRGYNCTMYLKHGNKVCTNHSIEEEKVLFFFKEFLKDVKREYEDHIKSIGSIYKPKDTKNLFFKCQKDLDNAKEELKLILNQKLKELLEEKRPEYRDVLEGAYSEIESEKKRKILQLTQRVKDLQHEFDKDIENQVKSSLEIFDDILNSETPERKHLEMILDKILVYGDRSLEFRLNVDIDRLIAGGTL